MSGEGTVPVTPATCNRELIRPGVNVIRAVVWGFSLMAPMNRYRLGSASRESRGGGSHTEHGLPTPPAPQHCGSSVLGAGGSQQRWFTACPRPLGLSVPPSKVCSRCHPLAPPNMFPQRPQGQGGSGCDGHPVLPLQIDRGVRAGLRGRTGSGFSGKVGLSSPGGQMDFGERGCPHSSSV